MKQKTDQVDVSAADLHDGEVGFRSVCVWWEVRVRHW